MKPLSNLQKGLLCMGSILILFAVCPIFSLGIQTAIAAVMLFLWGLMAHYMLSTKDKKE